MTENHPPDPGGPGAQEDPGGSEGGREADVLGAHLEFLRTRLGGERFEALVRAVQTTCTLLAEEQQVLLGGPQEGELTPDLRGEYLSLMAVMITGHLDHHLVEFRTFDGGRGWAVVENVRTRNRHPGGPPGGPPAARDAARHAWIDGRPDGIARTTDSPSP
ncbi:hypothetical protein OHA37_35725 [Streptomyces sp. NBC_00335]|uniref:hypothetical protein n=1 Tax=unclassified Streptomyces TaxID=2593676 RepID=UPI00224D7520|nr:MULTISPECIES: hypothetical protein [unclassified Streptomyces]MCX5409191.1 hypothetical protein [Streptomyces sp. NBC_00086]